GCHTRRAPEVPSSSNSGEHELDRKWPRHHALRGRRPTTSARTTAHDCSADPILARPGHIESTSPRVGTTRTERRRGPAMIVTRALRVAITTLFLTPAFADAQSWQTARNQPEFAASTPLLL